MSGRCPRSIAACRRAWLRAATAGRGPEHEDAVELGVVLDLGLVDGETAVAGLRQEASVALVADQGLVALLQLLLQSGQDLGAVGGVLPHLLVVAADDVAPPGERHRLGLVVDFLIAFGQKERDAGRGIVEYEFAHELVAALASAQDVEPAARLEFGDRLGADHAAGGDDADPGYGKALAKLRWRIERDY